MVYPHKVRGTGLPAPFFLVVFLLFFLLVPFPPRLVLSNTEAGLVLPGLVVPSPGWCYPTLRLVWSGLAWSSSVFLSALFFVWCYPTLRVNSTNTVKWRYPSHPLPRDLRSRRYWVSIKQNKNKASGCGCGYGCGGGCGWGWGCGCGCGCMRPGSSNL